MKYAGNGYSLIELWLVLGLVAILLCAGAASLQSTVESQALKSETKQIVSLLDNLSVRAMQHEKDIRLEIQSTGYAGYSNNICFLQGTLPRPLKFEEASTKSLLFLKNGVSSPGTLRLSDGKRTCLIILSLRGRVRSQCL